MGRICRRLLGPRNKIHMQKSAPISADFATNLSRIKWNWANPCRKKNAAILSATTGNPNGNFSDHMARLCEHTLILILFLASTSYIGLTKKRWKMLIKYWSLNEA